MQASYNLWLVALSILVAMVVSYTALRLAARVAEAGRSGGRLWLLGGAAAMGMGIWSMHFIGMLAFSVSIPLRYGIVKTLVSLAIAMVTSGFALAIASRPHLSLKRLAFGSVVMGTGICAMHYSGMAAIQIVPMITIRAAARRRLDRHCGRRFVRGAVACIQPAQRRIEVTSGWRAPAPRRSWDWRSAACTTRRWRLPSSRSARIASAAPSFDNGWLAATIGIVALGVLGLTLIMTVYDAHLLSQTRQDAKRLEQVNAALQHGKNLLALATRAAGISSWEMDIATQSTLWTENEIESLRAAGVDTRAHPGRHHGHDPSRRPLHPCAMPCARPSRKAGTFAPFAFAS